MEQVNTRNGKIGLLTFVTLRLSILKREWIEQDEDYNVNRKPTNSQKKLKLQVDSAAMLTATFLQ